MGKIKLADNVLDVLDRCNVRLLSIEKSHDDIVSELECFSPKKEQLIVTLWHKPTNKDFVRAFRDYAMGFDADDHALRCLNKISGTRKRISLRGLVEDADEVKKHLLDTAKQLNSLYDK